MILFNSKTETMQKCLIINALLFNWNSEKLISLIKCKKIFGCKVLIINSFYLT
jgi:hypothetical protein